MKDIKAVFFDFDWTLFNHKVRDFVDSAVSSIREIHGKGIKTFVNSARSYYALEKLGTFEKMPFDGFAVNNGGAAFTREKVIYAKYMAEDTVEKIIATARENGFSYLVCTLRHTYISRVEGDANVADFYSVYYEPHPLDISEYDGTEGVLAIQVFVDSGKDHLFDSIKGSVFNRFFEKAIELTSSRFKKDDGIKALISDYGFGKSELAAFGDDINDIDMFDLVEYGICMGNGKKEAMQHARFVTTNIDDDGIKNGLRKLGLLD